MSDHVSAVQYLNQTGILEQIARDVLAPAIATELRNHDDALRLALAASEARERTSARYAAFGEWAFEMFWNDAEPGDIDGGDAQEAAIKHGLLRRREDGDRYATCGGEMGCGWKDGDPVESCECLFPTTGPLSAPRDSEALKAMLEAMFDATLEATRSHCACDAEKSWSRAAIVARILSGGANG